MNKKFLKIWLTLVLVSVLWWVFFAGKEVAVPVVDMVSSDFVSGKSIRIIAFGDSLTAGYGVSQAESYPAQLEADLREKGYDVLVINSGVSGETTRGNLERANFIRSQNPDIVILGIGGNDALRALPIGENEKNISATVEILQSGKQPPHVFLLQMQAPLNAGQEYKERFDAFYKTLAEDKGLVLVPFITEDIFLDQNNKLADGIHYNQVGYKKVIDQYLLPRLEEVLFYYSNDK
ncbi:MAG: acyl-CoA thioesterase-1 [Candidatus Paceibacteria bacterium]|jgi:acyl-CoA thioesterase-1